MDRNSAIGLVLIVLLVTGYMFYTSVNYTPVEQNTSNDSLLTDTDTNNTQPPAFEAQPALTIPQNADSNMLDDRFGKYFASFAIGKQDFITIETELFTAKISSLGGAIRSFVLKKYNKWDGVPSELIWDDKGDLFLTFTTMDNKKIDTRSLFHKFDINSNSKITLKGNETKTINAILDLGEGKYINKALTFKGNEYTINKSVTFDKMDNIITRGYNLTWTDGLKFQEKNSVDEASDAKAIAVRNGEVDELDAPDSDENYETSLTGVVDYVAVKTKYFVAAIKPNNFDGTVDLAGKFSRAPNNGAVEKYDISIRIPYKGGKQTDDFLIYIGPIDYDILQIYQMEKVVNFGWWIIAYISEFFMMPIFMFAHSIIPNWGLAIIVFSIFIKFLIYPLSIGQMRTAQKMKLLTPELTKIREKYADDMQAQQRESMALYSQYGINPMGGCLPMILQMPILYSLWVVLRSNIELRQADFIWWITDLSMPDTLLHFGGSFLGISSISGLALAMAVTMFIQQKMTVTDPRQASMVYIMPVMFLFLFSNFPSGLNLYYFMFNLLSIIQQYWINNFSRKKMTLEDMKKMPKKEGWMQKKLREAQQIAESQGKVPPSMKKTTDSNPNTVKSNKRKKR